MHDCTVGLQLQGINEDLSETRITDDANSLQGLLSCRQDLDMLCAGTKLRSWRGPCSFPSRSFL